MSMDQFIDLTIESEIKATTAKAILVEYGDDEVWIPRTVLNEGHFYERGDYISTLEVKEWFAVKTELI